MLAAISRSFSLYYRRGNYRKVLARARARASHYRAGFPSFRGFLVARARRSCRPFSFPPLLLRNRHSLLHYIEIVAVARLNLLKFPENESLSESSFDRSRFVVLELTVLTTRCLAAFRACCKRTATRPETRGSRQRVYSASRETNSHAEHFHLTDALSFPLSLPLSTSLQDMPSGR